MSVRHGDYLYLLLNLSISLHGRKWELIATEDAYQKVETHLDLTFNAL
ncbi:MAG: hypothetical protein ACTS77_02705 [Arsenophonus sp. NC-TX2-MAG3]